MRNNCILIWWAHIQIKKCVIALVFCFNRKETGMARFKKGQSGNPKGKPKGAKSIAPLIREEFFKAVDELEKEGQPLSHILKQQLKKKPLETLRAVSAFSPREKNIEFDSGAIDYVDILIAAQPLREQKEKEMRNESE